MMTMTEIARDNRLRELVRRTHSELQALAKSLGWAYGPERATTDELIAGILDMETAR